MSRARVRMRRFPIVLFLSMPIAGGSSGQDRFPPRVMSLRVSTVGETWFEVEWETDEPTLGGVEWGRGGAYTNVTRETGSHTHAHFST